MTCPGEWPCPLEKTVDPAFVKWSVLSMSVKSTWLIISFNSSISLLILYLNVLLMVESKVCNILLLQNCLFVPGILSIFASCCGVLFERCIRSYLHPIFLTEWPFYQSIVSLLVCFNSFLLEVYFVCHQCRH